MPKPVGLDVRLGRKKAPTRMCRGLSLLAPWLPATRKTHDMSGCQPGRPRTGTNLRDGKNLQAVECHLDHTPTKCAAPDFRPPRTSPDDFSARVAGRHPVLPRWVLAPTHRVSPASWTASRCQRDQVQRFPPSLMNYCVGFAAALWIPRLALRVYRFRVSRGQDSKAPLYRPVP